MNRPGPVAERYADAFFELARDRGMVETVEKDVAILTKLLEESGDLRRVISDPGIPAEKFRNIFRDLFEGRLSEATYRFLLFLLDQNRLAVLPVILENFQRRYREESGILRARLTSYHALTESQIKDLVRKLEDHFHKKIDIENRVDPGLLGGFKVQIADTIYDLSIQTQLKNFKDAVMAA